MPSVRLADLTWRESEAVLTPESLVLIPLGAAAKEHGPHLRLDNDMRLAEALASRVATRSDIIVAPTITMHHYPAFAEYPGSISLRRETARDLVLDITRSLATFGPRKFYVVNTGLSTAGPLTDAATVLAHEGIHLRFTDWPAALAPAEREHAQQTFGTHADEVETSLILHLAPERVRMDLATRDGAQGAKGPLTRRQGAPGKFSPSGVYGDATLASAEKGAHFAEAIIAHVLRDLAQLRADLRS